MKKIYIILFLFSSLTWSLHAATLNLSLILSGYYSGSGMSYACLGGTNADTIIVELHDTAVSSTVYFSDKVILHVDGTATCIFPNSLLGKTCYIGIRHRNALETWSRPVTLTSTMSYDFTSSNSQSCGYNMILVDVSPDLWAFYQGDVNQDGRIDPLDSTIIANAFGAIGYLPTDLNCDGITDSLDINTNQYYTPIACTHFITTVNNSDNRPLRLSLTPNPVRNNLVINFSTPLKREAKMQLVNIFNQTMYSSDIAIEASMHVVDLSYLSSGLYFVSLQTEEGMTFQRFIKQ